ncbi:MAG TPA: DUF4899 domain-containing protein [bacterium]|nr:DUF4899 domain-containing protein [bacterium]
MTTRMQCTELEAQAALLATDNDTDRAIALLRRSIFGIKAKFRSELRKVCGVIYVFVDAEREAVERVHAVVTNEAWLYNTDLNQPVMEFEDYIINTEFRIKTVTNLMRDVNDRLKERLKFDTLKRFVAAMVAENQNQLVEILRTIISGELADRELDFMVKVEKINRVKFDKMEKAVKQVPPAGEAAAEEGEAAAAPADEAKEKVLILKTDIILSPISGRAIRKLKIGDKIYVKIIDNSPQGRYIANLLKGNAPLPQPVLVPIKEMTRTESDRCSIITQFGPGVFGRVVVNTEAKIKSEGTEVVADDEEPGAAAESTLLPIMLGGGILLLALVFIAWYFLANT